MDDSIYRQAAIDSLIKWYGGEPSDTGAFENIIEKLAVCECGFITDGIFIFCPNCGAEMEKSEE